MKRTLAALLPYLAALCVLTACGGSATNVGRSMESQDADAPAALEAVAGRSGLQLGEVTSQLDENPTRAIRRSIDPIRQTLMTRFDGKSVPEDFYLYRNTLSAQYQSAYDQVCRGLMKKQSSIPLSTPVPVEDFQYIYYTVQYDHPEIFWITLQSSYSYNEKGQITEIRPVYWGLDLDKAKAEVENSVRKALSDMSTLRTDVEKVKYAHDYLTHTITYAHNDMDQTAYSGFVWKQTVCAGYAKCFSYLMHKMGIPCASVVGDAGGPHAWNILKLAGEYYVMDVTWDDYDQGPDVYSYNYFNITDRQISANHTRGMKGDTVSLKLPVANGTAMSYQNAFGGNAYGTDFDAFGDEYYDYPEYGYDDDDEDDEDNDWDDADDDVDEDDEDNDWDDADDDDWDWDDADDDDWDWDDDDDDDWDWDDDDDDDWDWDDDDDDWDFFYDDEDFDYDDYYDNGEWWKWLDDDWDKDDWDWDDDDDYWYIYDSETDFTYVYDQSSGYFGARSEDEPDTIYWLDPETGEWEE